MWTGNAASLFKQCQMITWANFWNCAIKVSPGIEQFQMLNHLECVSFYNVISMTDLFHETVLEF